MREGVEKSWLMSLKISPRTLNHVLVKSNIKPKNWVFFNKYFGYA